MAATFAAASSSSPFLTSPPPPPPFLPSSSFSSHLRHNNHHLSFPLSPLRVPIIYTVNNNNTSTVTANPRKPRTLILTSSYSDSDSSSLGDEFLPNRPSRSADKKSVLSDLIQEIEPLDVSVIQKDVPLTTLDAMKRTISGMLGLLPSDRFQVFIESLWEPLSKLLVSSMMTGYTLWNAEYRLCLERNLGIHEGDLGKQSPEHSKLDLQEAQLDSTETNQCSQKDDEFVNSVQGLSSNLGVPGLDEISPEVQEYILHLQSRLSSVKKELHEVKRKSAALQMQQFVGEEKNDLLDYLRSLEPEKVAELSEPTSPEVKETIHSVVHGLLATLSPKMHSRAPLQSENTPSGTLNIGGEDCAELVENTSLQFQPSISLTRDYLARLLFWCMLLGHHIRGLEYRMELMELLSLTSDSQNVSNGDEQAA